MSSHASHEAVDEIATTLPPPLAAIRSAATRSTLNVPSTLTSSTWRQSAGRISRNGTVR